MLQQYIDFFLNSDRDVVGIETYEISHPSLSKTYYFVVNVENGIDLIDENGVNRHYEYMPIVTSRQTDNNTLDYQITVNIGDAGTVLPDEIERLIDDGTWSIKPKLVKRDYRSDSMAMMRLEKFDVHSVTTRNEGSSLSCGAPKLNYSRRGLIQDLRRFPTLAQFR